MTFASCNRDYSKKVNKKMYKHAMCSILSELLRQERLKVVESLQIDEAKTKKLVGLLNGLSLENVLIITDQADTKLELAARNLIQVDVRQASAVDPVSLIKFDNVLILSDAIKTLEERLA